MFRLGVTANYAVGGNPLVSATSDAAGTVTVTTVGWAESTGRHNTSRWRWLMARRQQLADRALRADRIRRAGHSVDHAECDER